MTALDSPHDRFFKTVFGRTEVVWSSWNVICRRQPDRR